MNNFSLARILCIATLLFVCVPTQAQDSMDVECVRSLYLDMIKKTILNTVYEPDPAKEEGYVWPKTAHTMIGMKRMNNIQYCVENIIANKVQGDFIETGVWRGGATIFMRALLKAYGIKDRFVWVADSFQGLPAPDLEKYPADSNCGFYQHENFLKVSLEQVKENFKAYGLLDDQVIFLKGFFKDTMPNNQIKKLALLRLDGDMYQSTMEVLEALYDKLSINGYIIIDDYALKEARKAVDDFRAKRGITEEVIIIDCAGAYWKKLS